MSGLDISSGTKVLCLIPSKDLWKDGAVEAILEQTVYMTTGEGVKSPIVRRD